MRLQFWRSNSRKARPDWQDRPLTLLTLSYLEEKYQPHVTEAPDLAEPAVNVSAFSLSLSSFQYKNDLSGGDKYQLDLMYKWAFFTLYSYSPFKLPGP